MAPRRAPVDFEVFKAIGLGLPDVVDSSTPRGAALKLRGRLMACEATHRSAEPNSLMLRIGIDERARLIMKHPKVFYVTEHYENSAAVLVRLSRISRSSLAEVLGISWRFVFEKAGGHKTGRST